MEILQISELIASFSDKLWSIFKSDYHVKILITKLLLVSLMHPSLSTRNCSSIKGTGSFTTDFAETFKLRCDLRVQKNHNII